MPVIQVPPSTPVQMMPATAPMQVPVSGQKTMPGLQIPPSTPVQMMPATAPKQVPVSGQKIVALPVLQLQPSTPVQILPATAPMQVPVAVPMGTLAPAHPNGPPVAVQPQPQTSVVLNVQGGPQMYDHMAMGLRGGSMGIGPVAWSTGLLQCCDDIPVCLLGSCCSCIFPCYLASLFGEACCFGMLPGAMFALRTGVRERYRIPGSLLNDYCAICCCLTCALCQMAREIKGREWQNRRLPMPWRT